MRLQSSSKDDRGYTLVEVVVALFVFTITALSASLTLLHSMEHRNQSFQRYAAVVGLRNIVAEIQDHANLPYDVVKEEGIGMVYSSRHQTKTPIPQLPSGSITITCFADEATVPAELGGPQDLNFDGDATDNLGNQSSGTDLKIVPMTLSVTFDDRGTPQILTLHRLITKTTE